MKKNNVRKLKIYVSFIVMLCVMGGMFWWLSRQHHPGPEVSENSGTALPTQQDPDMADRIASLSTWFEAKSEEIFQATSTPTEASKAEVSQMLSKLEPLEGKSVSEIVRILIGFYPEEERDAGLFDFYIQMYEGYGEIDQMYQDSIPPRTKEQKVLELVQIAQEDVASLRLEEKVIEEMGQIRRELRRLDPAAYHTAEIQRYKAKIPETEARIREAEAKGDSEDADFLRAHLTALHDFIESEELMLEFEQREEVWKPREQEAVRKAIAEWEHNPPEWLKEYRRSMASIDKLKEALEALEAGAASPATSSEVPVPPPSEAPGPLPSEVPVPPPSEALIPLSSFYDPVRSLETTQEALRPLRLDLDEKYLDVVVSQHLTPTELAKYFPTAEAREILKRRTSDMQEEVVSQIRKVVNDVKGATAAQRRELARELVIVNFEKDFAKAVLTELAKDPE